MRFGDMLPANSYFLAITSFRTLCLSRVEMKAITLFSSLLIFLPLLTDGQIWGFGSEREMYADYVWEYSMREFTQEEYTVAVEKLLKSFEERTGRSLNPGVKRRVGLKVYTNSGSGIATPVPLVQAVIKSLLKRGYRREEIFLLDLNETRLRQSGFIPILSKGEGIHFEGVPVKVLDRNELYDPVWFYESALYPKGGMPYPPDVLGPYEKIPGREERKSYLPKPLLTDVDFWVNMPVAMDHPALGVSGAIGNATLWNISNRERFFFSASNAPIAAAEIAAIPEIVASLAVTIMPLECYQFVGGPVFNSLYTRSERRLWMSVNPVILDALVLERINLHRNNTGFQNLGANLPLLHFAESLGLGTGNTRRVRWIRF